MNKIIDQEVVLEAKGFKVAAISQNHNSFGLRGHVIIAKDGEAWEVGRSISDPVQWQVGSEVVVTRHNDREDWAFIGCELPRRLPKAPANVVRTVFAVKSPARASA